MLLETKPPYDRYERKGEEILELDPGDSLLISRKKGLNIRTVLELVVPPGRKWQALLKVLIKDDPE